MRSENSNWCTTSTADNWHTNQLHKVHEIGKVIRNWLIDAQATISITIAVLSSLVCIGSVFVRNKLCSFKIMSPDLMFSNTQTNANRSTRVHYVCCCIEYASSIRCKGMKESSIQRHVVACQPIAIELLPCHVLPHHRSSSQVSYIGKHIIVWWKAYFFSEYSVWSRVYVSVCLCVEVCVVYHLLKLFWASRYLLILHKRCTQNASVFFQLVTVQKAIFKRKKSIIIIIIITNFQFLNASHCNQNEQYKSVKMVSIINWFLVLVCVCFVVLWIWLFCFVFSTDWVLQCYNYY